MIYENTIKGTIVNGPSKMDLVTALAYAFDNKREPFSVTFDLIPADDQNVEMLAWRAMSREKSTPIKAKIMGLSHENGSGESFIVTGYLDYYENSSKPFFDRKFQAYYNTAKRKGTVSFTLLTGDEK